MVYGQVVFDGPEPPPASVSLSFTGERLEERPLAISGRQTSYRFGIDAQYVASARGELTSPVASDAFWLPSSNTADVRLRPSLLDLLLPPVFDADPIVFARGVRFALPITDRAGKPFRPPRGWRSRGGSFSINDEDSTFTLAPGARTVEGLTGLGRLDLSVRLDYVDSFGVEREIRPRLDDVELDSSQAGTTVTRPRVMVDASPPVVRAVRLRGRGYAMFVARDPQSSVESSAAAAYILIGRRWRALPDSSIATVQEDDPDSRYVPIGRTGFRVQSLRGGRHKVRLCVRNADGVMATFARCATTTVGVGR